MNTDNQISRTRSLVVCLSIALSGCAGFSKDGGLADVQVSTRQYLKQEIAWPRTDEQAAQVNTQVAALLQQRLNVDSAVQIALLNNKGLQATFSELGISEADVVQAGRLPNPRFSMLYARNDGDYKIEQAFTFNIFALLTLPKIQEIEQGRYEQTKQSVALEVLRLANRTRTAYFQAVAASEQLHYSEQVRESAEASAELARRMVKAGNFNTLQQAREQGFYADAALDYANARHKQSIAYEILSRLLAVDVARMKLAERLPDLPGNAGSLKPFENQGLQQRHDLKAMQAETETLARQLGLTRTTRFINVLEIGPARVLEGRRGDAYKKGVTFSFELPLFDWSQARVAKAEAIYMQSVNRTAQMAIDAESEIREAYSSYRASYDIARHYRDEVIPLRKKILAENQLRYNGMLVSPFELLADARAQVSGVKSYIESLREFWLAESALDMSLLGSTTMMEGK